MCFCEIIKSFFRKGKNTKGNGEGIMIDKVWTAMMSDPEKIYYTETNLPFKVIMSDNSFRVRRITANGDFIVKQELQKENLFNAILLRPLKLSDISKKVRGVSYCYAIIKEYKDILYV